MALCGMVLAHPGGVNAPSPDLPPIAPDNEYLSPADVHARYAGPALEIVLSMIPHQPFAAQPPFLGLMASGSASRRTKFPISSLNEG